MAQSPDKDAGTSQIIRYDLGWNAINAMLRAGRSLSGHERNCCFMNTRGARFANVSAASGLDLADDGRVLSLADWDYDGDLDFWVANRSGPQVRFLQNNHGSSMNRVAFHLEGTQCNRDAIGAKIVLTWRKPREFRLTHTMRSSDGYLSQSTRWAHFGLGKRDSIDYVNVVWPDGDTQSFENVSPNKWYRVRQGDSKLQEWEPPSFKELSPKEFTAPPISDKARIVLLRPIPLPEMQYQTESGTVESANRGVVNARLINVWATWCEPCLRELTEWKEHAAELSDAGIEIVAVNVDERDPSDSSPSSIQSADEARSMDLPFPLRHGDARLTERLDVVQRSLLSRQRPLPLPSSYLLDRRGRLRAIYKGPVDVETLLADANLIDGDADQILAAAMPFDGRWLHRPGGSSPLQIAVKLIEGDYQDDAIRYIQSLADDPPSMEEFGSASLLNLLGALQLDRKEFQKAAKAFSQSLQLDPTNRTANIELGTLLLAINRGAAAEKNFRFVLQATPGDPELNYKLGVALLQQNKLNEAGRQMQKVLKLRPDAMAHWQLGEILLRLKRVDRAVVSYEKAISIQPELARSANNLAWILATSRDDAIRQPVRALELAKLICESAQTPDANQLDTLSAAHASNGDFKTASLIATRAMEVAGQDSQFASLVDEISNRMRLYEQAQPYRE